MRRMEAKMRIDSSDWRGAIARIDPVHAETMEHHPVHFEVCELPFYRRMKLVLAEIGLPHRIVELQYAGSPKRLFGLHTVADLYALNTAERVRIEGRDLAEYVRLYLLVAGRGRWRLIRCAEDVPLRVRDERWRQRLAETIARLQVTSLEDGSNFALATVLDGNELVQMELHVARSGRMDMRRGATLLADVPVKALVR